MKTVRSSFEHLLKDLKYNLLEYKQYEKEGGNGIFNSIGREQTSTDSTGSGWSRFIHILCYLPYPSDARYQLIKNLQEYYRNNESKLREIDDFEKKYTPENAIRWYTRDTFLFKLMNKAFLLRDPQLMFYFGFFVRDLYLQLRVEYENYQMERKDNPIIKVYRGQIMSRNEIATLDGILDTEMRDDRINTFLAATTFLSTTLDRDVATAFLMRSTTSDDQIQGVLFEIDLDLRLKSRPYAAISHLSYITDESEVLFVIGCVFKLYYIRYDENEKIWICKLKLINDFDYNDVKEYESTSERRTLKTCVTVLLHDVKSTSFHQAIKIFDMLIQLFPLEKWISAAKFHFLLPKCIPRDEDHGIDIEQLQPYKKATEMWMEYVDDVEINCFVEIGNIHRRIASYYSYFDQETMAKEYYELAVVCYQCAIENTATEYEQMKINDLLAWVDRSDLENTRTAIEYKKLHLENMLCYKFTDEFMICDAVESIGKLYKDIKEYDDALMYYDRALSMLLQIKPILPFRKIQNTLKCILKIYHKKQPVDLQSILKYQLIKHEYTIKDATETLIADYYPYYDVDYESDVKMTQQTIAASHIELAHCYIDVNEYHLANEHLLEAIRISKDFHFSHYKCEREKIKELEQRLKEYTKLDIEKNIMCIWPLHV